MVMENEAVGIKGVDILYPIKPSDRNSDKVSMYSNKRRDTLS
jgi:hypothetical protein